MVTTDDTLQRVLDSELNGIQRRFVEAKERYLLQVFGSYEKAKEVAHLYVFEEDNFQFEDDHGGKMSVSYTFRVRPKTAQELEADGERQRTEAKEEIEYHEWKWVEFNFAGWIECAGCGFRPQNQDEMDEHIPPSATVSLGT